MSQRPFLITAGLPELTAAVRRAGIFPQVVDADSVSALLAAFSRQDLAQRRPDDVVLAFADNLVEDHQMPLIEVLRRLTGAGYHVIIVSATARGADLARQFPKAGLLPLPVTVNNLLYAVNVFGYHIDPIEEVVPQPGHTPASSPAGHAAPPAPRTQSGGGWGTPAQRAATNEPAADPAVFAPGGWGDRAPRDPVATDRPPTAGPSERPAGGEWAPGGPSGYLDEPTTPHVPLPGGLPAQNTTTGRPALFQPAQPNPPTQPQPAATGPATWSPSAATAPSPQSSWGAATTPAQGAPVSREGAYTAVPASVGRRGHVITIAVSKGGTGKSSLTLNLGAFLGMRLRMLGKTVCVIDANFQQADSGKYLDRYTPNISTIAKDPSLLTRERILEGLVHKPEYNLSVLLGPATPDEGNPLNVNEDLYIEILELLREHFDYILIDTPVAEKYHYIFQKFALPRADYIIVPVAPNYPTLHNAHNWLTSAVVQPRHAGGAGVDPARIGIVLNRAEEDIGCSEQDVRVQMANWQFLGSIPERKEWKLANNRNELIAPKAYAELNEAFATILYAATGEAVLLSNIEAAEKKKGLKGILSRLSRGAG